jgi:hypothetical protein
LIIFGIKSGFQQAGSSNSSGSAAGTNPISTGIKCWQKAGKAEIPVLETNKNHLRNFYTTFHLSLFNSLTITLMTD